MRYVSALYSQHPNTYQVILHHPITVTDYIKLVAGEGVEPSVRAYETCVLPLHHPTLN